MKKIISLLFISLCCLFGLTACNQPASVYGNFNKSEYVLSLEENLDLYKELNLNGASQDEITITFSNEKILTKDENGFIASQSGSTVVFANYGQTVIAKCNVLVNYQFSAPTDLKITQDGKLYWNESVVYKEDKIVTAFQYIVKIGQNKQFKVDTNCFDFALNQLSYGSYTVKVQAVGVEQENILSSQFSQTTTIIYDYVSLVEGLNVEVSTEFSNQNVVLSWNHTEESVYDVYLNNFKVNQQVLTDAQFTYDFSRFENGRDIEVKIVAYDKNNEKLSSSAVYNIKKLDSVSPVYNYDQKDGYLTFEDAQNAFGYILQYSSVDGSVSGQKIVQSGQSEFLDDLKSGLYNVSIQVLGGQNEYGLFVNSNISQSLLFAKLTTPSAQVEITGEGIEVSIEDLSQYVENYKIVSGNYEEIFSIKDEKQIFISKDNLLEGENAVYVYALPTKDQQSSTGVKSFAQDQVSTNCVITSGAYQFEVFVLNPIEQISHEFDDENENISTLTFNNVDFADSFNVYVNDTKPDDILVQIGQNETTITFENLNQIEPNSTNSYTIKVEALRQDGKSISSFGYKTLQILQAPTKVQSENGQFRWNEVEGAYFQYFIYKTDANGLNEELFANEVTNELLLKENLEFGYYKIEVRALSLDESAYLDSDFYDKTNILEENFLVYKQIESPQIQLIEENGIFKIEIKPVEYAGHYSVKLDGQEIDSFDVVESQDVHTRILDGQDFANEKIYNLTVQASAGNLYDEKLHTPSNESLIKIVRISKPTATLEEIYSQNGRFGIDGEYGDKTGEILTVSSSLDDFYVDHYEILINGEKANTLNQNYVNLLDYGQTFTVVVNAIAKENYDNLYLLSSDQTSIVVNRLPSPLNLSFDNEIVSYQDLNEGKTEKYFVSIELFIESGNRTINFFVQGTSFNLQDQIDKFLLNNSFKNEFAQSTQIGVTVYAYTEPVLEDGALTLQSTQALTSNGDNRVIIQKMQTPVLTFDPSSEVFKWEKVGDDTVYDVYCDGEIVVEDYTSNSINLSQVAVGKDLTVNDITVKIVAKNSKYLSSSQSNDIVVAKHSLVKNLIIAQNANKWQATIIIDDDANARRISQILVNDQAISYTTGQTRAVVDLSNYDQNKFALSISLKALNSQSENIYYIDSDLSQFVLEDISSQSLNATIDNDILTWKNPYLAWQESLEIVSFKIIVDADGQIYTINNYKNTSLSIQEIETLVKTTFKSGQQLNITITSNIEPFETDASKEARYGVASQSDILTSKVLSIGNVEKKIVLSNDQDEILQQINSKVALTFANIWTSEVYFDIYINSNLTFNDLSTNNPYENCSLVQNEDDFVLSINSSLFALAGKNSIEIIAKQTNKISSDKTSIVIERNDDILNASLSEEGVLNLSYGKVCQDQVLVKIIIGNQSYFNLYDAKKTEIDLNELLKGKSGGIEIQIIVVDSNLQTLCSLNSFVLNEVKLAQIKNISIKDDGQMLLTLSDLPTDSNGNNIEFIVRTQSGEELLFYPSQTEDLYVYSYSLQDFKTLLSISQEGSYKLNIANRMAGSINSDFIEYDFNYKIENNEDLYQARSTQNSDYIVFKLLSNETALSTCGFRFIITDKVNHTITKINFMLSEYNVRGYWDNYTNKFYVDKPSGNDYFECFAFSLNEMFDGYEYGNFQIEACRIAKQGEEFYIYSSKTFDIMKLNNVIEDSANLNTARIENNILKWSWTKPTDILEQNFAPSAFMVTYWPISDSTQPVSVVVNGYSLNLTTLSMQGGYNYLTIQAVSENQNIISSSNLENLLEPFKYYQTKPVTLQNGKIVFNLNKNGVLDKTLDFVRVFDVSVTGENLADNLATIGQNGFDDIYYFDIDSVANQTIKLKFVSTDFNGSDLSGQTYIVSVNAMDLLPNFTVDTTDFLTQIQNYIDGNLLTSGENIYQFVMFNQTIKEMAQGLTEGKILFDDFGKQIPAGYYNVSTIQTSTNSKSSYIDSDPSSAKVIYVASPVSSHLQNEFDSVTGEETYTSSYNLTSIAQENGELTKATSYKFLLRAKTSSGEQTAYQFDISYNNEWSIRYNNQSLENVISGDDSSFKINYSVLGDYVYDGDYLIDKAFVYNVYIYAVGNDYSCYGKSNVMSLTFLSLDNSNLSIENGNFIITTSKNEIGSDILVKYRREYGSSSEVQQQIVKAGINSQGKVVLSDLLTNAGLYDYVIFNVMGQIDDENSIMKLPSVSYGILNVYKLSSPSLTTSENKLVISAQSKDNIYGPFKYQLYNDLDVIVSTNQFFDADGDNLSQIIFDHTQTCIDGQNDVNFISQTIFDVPILDYDNDDEQIPFFEKIIDIDQIVLASNTSSISLQTLSSSNQIRLDGGDLVWEAVQSNLLDENTQIVYKIQIDYYDRTGYKTTGELWTKQTSLDSALLENSYTQGVGAYFNISLYVYAGQDAEYGHELIEGGYIDVSSALCFTNGKNILHSNPITTENISKTQSPSFAITEQIYKGKIAILRDSEMNFALKLIDANKNEFNLIENEDFTVEEGQIIQSDNSAIDVYFISIINEKYASSTAFTLEIFAYTESTIKSEKLVTKEIYKFPAVKISDLELSVVDIGQDEKNNVLSLEQYFNRNKYSFSSNMYQILFQGDEGRFILNSQNMSIDIEAFAGKTFEIFVEPIQGENSYLSSEALTITFANLNNMHEINFYFVENELKFEWTFKDSNLYNFYVELEYNDGLIESAYTNNYTIKNEKNYFYYQPKRMGAINKISLYAKILTSEENVYGIYNFVGSWIDNYIFDLFAGGNGTKNDPYIIENEQQFRNIALRNDVNNTVYFALSNSLELNLDEANKYIFDIFHGQLDGRGYTIKVNATTQVIENKSILYSVNLGNSTTSVQFENGQSIFKEISANAKVSNLAIDYSLDYSAVSSFSPIVFSPLAIINYGTISQVTINSADLNLSSNITTLAIGGIVGFNFGTIEESQNNSVIDERYPSQSAIRVLYGGIVLVNQTQGLIKGCQNNGQINLTIRRDLSSIYLGGIVCENNGGEITACGNNANITVSGNYQFTSAVASIASRNVGQITYVFNNGQISSPQGVGGIVYYFRSGTFGYVFEMSGNNVLASAYASGANITQNGEIYAYNNTIIGITIQKLPDAISINQEFVAGDYKLIVSQDKSKIILEK